MKVCGKQTKKPPIIPLPLPPSLPPTHPLLSHHPRTIYHHIHGFVPRQEHPQARPTGREPVELRAHPNGSFEVGDLRRNACRSRGAEGAVTLRGRVL